MRSGHRRKYISRGFTLLEVLVVLVLVGLISMLLFELLDHMLNLRLRFSEHSAELRQNGVKARWFRDSTRALHPASTDTEPDAVFRGDADDFSGLTLVSLEADAGVPMRFGWELRRVAGGTELFYRPEQGDAMFILRWTGEGGGFQYLDQTLTWREQWPPPSDDAFALLLQHPQLPVAIALQGIRRGKPFLWLVDIPGRKRPRQDFTLNQ